MINVHNSANRDFLPFLRRIYHIVSFYLFFFNVVLGLFSCLRRILMSLVFGLMLISRLDRCLLMRGFERFDAGTFYVKYLDYSEQLSTTLSFQTLPQCIVSFAEINTYYIGFKENRIFMGLHIFFTGFPDFTGFKKSFCYVQPFLQILILPASSWYEAHILL